MAKKDARLDAEILDLIVVLLKRYVLVSEYIEQKMFEQELLSTQQVAEKYFVSRHTVGRLYKNGHLKLIAKKRSNYFDAEETRKFFQTYWQKN